MSRPIIAPWKGEPGVICCPMKWNVPDPPPERGWEIMECPVCGGRCWLTPEAKAMAAEKPYMKLACTSCATSGRVKAGEKAEAGKEFERIIRFQPAFDKRHPDPAKNYGIHGVEMECFLKGPRGTVQFMLFTNWYLPHVAAELDGKCHASGFCYRKPSPAKVNYHSPVPMRDGQKPATEHCEWTGGKCYSDGSFLAADDIFKRLVSEGDEGLWTALEEEYRRWFPEEARP